MHYLNNGSQVENVPPLKPRVGLGGYFSESNDNGAPSYPGQDWFNAVIREFQTALAASGVAFDPDKFDHLQVMLTNASKSVRNLFEANQNFNAPGVDGILTSLNQTFSDKQEFSHGWVVTGGTDLIDIKRVSGEVTATSGKIQRAYPKDPAGILSSAKVFGSVTRKDGTQTYADTLSTNGIEVTEDASNVYLNIDFSVYNNGIAFVGLGCSRGEVCPISDERSMFYQSRYVVDFDYSNNGFIEYSDGIIEQWGFVDHTTSSGVVTFSRAVSVLNISLQALNPSYSPNGSEYTITALTTTDFTWQSGASDYGFSWKIEGRKV